MNKGDLVNEVAKVTRTKKGAREAVNRVFTTIIVALLTNKKVTVKGFGTFRVVKRKARIAMNPWTDKRIKIMPKNVIKFVAAKDLKEAVQ